MTSGVPATGTQEGLQIFDKHVKAAKPRLVTVPGLHSPLSVPGINFQTKKHFRGQVLKFQLGMCARESKRGGLDGTHI